jgi:hypothetical protein
MTGSSNQQPGTGPLRACSQNPEPLAALVDAIAARVVELLRSGGPAPAQGGLLTTRQVAQRLGLSTDWVREHRQELGVLPASGDRPRLLFDPAAVEEFATARMASERSAGPDSTAVPSRLPHRSRARTGDGPDLLPIRGRVVA